MLVSVVQRSNPLLGYHRLSAVVTP